MALVDLFTFREMFREARSMAVVGNASSLGACTHGPAIDAHDLVVRFNRAQTAGLEARIGGRTDVLVANCWNAPEHAPPPLETLRPRCVVCFVSPADVLARDPAPLRAWVGDLPLLVTFGPDVLDVTPCHRTRPLTMGTYTLYALPRLLELERIFLTGFTMFGAVAGGATSYYQPRRQRVGDWHDLDQEARIFADVVRSFRGQVRATPEVKALLDRGSAPGRLGRGLPGIGLRQRLAGRLAWGVLTLGLRLRRLGESGRRGRSA